MADETEREALARLIWGAIRDHVETGDSTTDGISKAVRDAILAAGYVSPSRHRAEVEALTAERDAAVVALAQREAECARLRSALEPFAKLAPNKSASPLVGDLVPVSVYVEVGRIRRARAALSPIPADPESDNG